MRFKFIANACGIFLGSKGTKLLMDPWLDDGVFEGSWCHFPPLKTKHFDLQDVDIIYLSHIHPDHYDQRFFNYRKDIPILVLKNKHNFLVRNLIKDGYTNILQLEDSQKYEFKEFSLTLFEPFAKGVFHDSNLGNLIDSALVIEDIDGTKAFNANDNTPTLDACEKLKLKFGQIDLAMLNYNCAGPYPSCFQNLSFQEKKEAHNNLLDRNINHLISCCDILEPISILPFAGAYVLGGKEWEKNEYLGTTTWDECAKLIRKKSLHKVITIQENNIYDLKERKLEKKYKPVDISKMNQYIESTLSKIIYPYENDLNISDGELYETLNKSLEAFQIRLKNFNIKLRSNIIIKTDNKQFIINKGDEEFNTKLTFSLDQRLLMRILKKEAQWNSAEIGCHINILREPNNYEIDAHTMMQFLHI